MLSPGVGQSLPALVRRLGTNTATTLYSQTLTAVRDDVCALIDDERIACDLQLAVSWSMRAVRQSESDSLAWPR